jgi:hypothetical protein
VAAGVRAPGLERRAAARARRLPRRLAFRPTWANGVSPS